MNEKLKQLFVKILKIAPERFSDALAPEDVKGWDSLGHLMLIEAIEEQFSIKVSETDAAAMDSVGAIRQVLERHQVG